MATIITPEEKLFRKELTVYEIKKMRNDPFGNAFRSSDIEPLIHSKISFTCDNVLIGSPFVLYYFKEEEMPENKKGKEIFQQVYETISNHRTGVLSEPIVPRGNFYILNEEEARCFIDMQ